MTMAEYPTLLVAAMVIIFNALLPIPNEYSPLNLCQKLAYALALKVNRPVPNQPGFNKQKFISGLMALITYFILVLTILWALLFIMPDDGLNALITEAVLLYISLGYFGFSRQSKIIEQALNKKQHAVAKSYLAELVNTDANVLSPLGITKTVLELEVTHWFSRWLMPLILFLAFGGVLSLSYVLLAILCQAWPSLAPNVGRFGQPALLIKSLLDWPITILCAPIYSIFKSSPGWLTLYNQNKSQWPNNQSKVDLLWMCIVASGCKIEMAGPLMYAGTKVKRIRLNEGQHPDQNTIRQLRHWHRRVVLFVTGTILLFWFLGNYF